MVGLFVEYYSELGVKVGSGFVGSVGDVGEGVVIRLCG